MSFHQDTFHQKFNYEVLLTAPQHELSNGTIAMFWFPDTEVSASSEAQAEKIVRKMIENDEIEVDIMDENGDSLTDSEYREALQVSKEYGIQPEIDTGRTRKL